MRESLDLHVHRILFPFVFKDSVFFISLSICVFSVNFDEMKRRTQDSVDNSEKQTELKSISQDVVIAYSIRYVYFSVPYFG